MMRMSEKFYSRVVHDEPTGCHIWMGSVNVKTGYGKAYSNGKQLGAHQVAFTLSGRVVADGLVIDHICRNRRCVNPAHLQAITNRQNVLSGIGITSRAMRKRHLPSKP